MYSLIRFVNAFTERNHVSEGVLNDYLPIRTSSITMDDANCGASLTTNCIITCTMCAHDKTLRCYFKELLGEAKIYGAAHSGRANPVS